MFNGPTYEYFRLLIYWSTDHMVYRSTYCVNYLLQSVGHLVSRTTGLLVNWPIRLLVYTGVLFCSSLLTMPLQRERTMLLWTRVPRRKYPTAAMQVYSTSSTKHTSPHDSEPQFLIVDTLHFIIFQYEEFYILACSFKRQCGEKSRAVYHSRCTVHWVQYSIAFRFANWFHFLLSNL